ncbi:hypothetical protein CASFOL_030175 [Castilleja foliolosa]|uniref:Uncharacterized protein n=1 Tax=Castilleja foliolosa TaxID=1961234 RepID=A0ABD3CBB1_9LAMI
MAINIITPSGAALTALFIFLLHLSGGGNAQGPNFEDSDYVELALNLEYLETEFFLFGALGKGLDGVTKLSRRAAHRLKEGKRPT